jgi:hypothetical protein
MSAIRKLATPTRVRIPGEKSLLTSNIGSISCHNTQSHAEEAGRCIEEQQEVHYTLAGKSEPDETAIFP